MQATSCEQIRLAAMALADGEHADLSAEEIAAHLAACGACRRAVAEMTSLVGLLSAQKRQAVAADFWPLVQPQVARAGLARRAAGVPGWLVGLLALVLACRVLVLLAQPASGWLVKLAALALVVALFGVRRENPFAIESQLFVLKERSL